MLLAEFQKFDSAPDPTWTSQISGSHRWGRKTPVTNVRIGNVDRPLRVRSRSHALDRFHKQTFELPSLGCRRGGADLLVAIALLQQTNIFKDIQRFFIGRTRDYHMRR